MVDTDTLAAYTLEQMKDGNNTISLTDANCYLQPEIISEDFAGQTCRIQSVFRFDHYL